MKHFLVLILLGLQLVAAEPFWQQVVAVEAELYAPNNDANDSEAAGVDAKLDAFAALITALKAAPYSVENPVNPFFHPSNADAQLYRLSAKIRVNREQGNSLAETRDRLAVETLKLQQRIFVFFASLAAEWTTLDTEALGKRVQEEIDQLRESRIEEEIRTADAVTEEGEIADALRTNAAALQTHYLFYKELLDYLQLHPQSLQYRSLLQRIKLDSLLTLLNDNAVAAEINTGLRYVNTDVGRLTLFAASLLIAWMVAALLYYRVYRLMQHLITRKQDLTDEMMLNNIESIRRPLFVMILAYGLQVGLEILKHPSSSEEESTLFFFVYLATFSYIVIRLVDNLFYHFLHQRTALKNRQMRSELVNLILSIIKIVIIITALLFFLVHIGVNITGLVASLGIGGLAVALAAKDTLSNFFGLLKILSDNAFSQGDWIQAGDVEGTVVEIGFISTDIRTFDNALITVPNEKLANVPLKNYNRRKVGRRIKMHVGVTYGSDREALARAIDAIRQMLLEHPDTVVPGEYDTEMYNRLKKREKRLISVEDKFGIKTSLMVYLDQLSASSMDILIYTFTNTVNWEEWLSIKQDIIFKIWEILDANGLEFAFPSQSLYFDKDNIRDTVEPMFKNQPEK
ncbi:mechanosensitive ion channel family protein [Thiomicrolovo sp. ZZH C-3]